MGLKQEEQITRYFEHRMSPGEEQNFLISLAASDELRIAFRSHLELMKAVRQDKDDLRSVAQVRNRTLTALGLSATAMTPFIEQELMRSASPSPKNQGLASPVVEAALDRPWWKMVQGLVRTPKLALGTGLLLGFLSAATLLNLTGSHTGGASNTHPSIQQTSTGSNADRNRTEKVASDETIPAINALHTITRPAASPVKNRQAHALIPKAHVAANSRTTLDMKNASVPVQTLSRQGVMDVNKATIKSPNDSVTAR
ncbi:MAG TPA: hypothetical protein VG537_07370 [Candidatus Kapabacteria bacterium]|jgi:hypothetical protein|nr:hypothetical protein [Candidatus Kapabacteria bacterium]